MRLTSTEIEILNILWRTGRGMTAIDIVDETDSLLLNTVFGAVRELVKNGMVENIGNLPCKKTSSRGYRPTEASREFILNKFISEYDGFQRAAAPADLCAAILCAEDDPERLTAELEKLKRLLDDCERELKKRS